MKKSLFLCLLLLSFNSFAESVEEANGLFDKRGESKENALKAADMFKSLAAKEANQVAAGKLNYKESQALYFYGARAKSKDAKKSIHKRALNAGMEAIKKLSKSEGVPVDGATKTELATAHYFYAINLGRWGQANGISSSIGELPKMMKNVNLVLKLDETVDEFGALRTSGRTKHKVPAALARLMGLSDFGTEDAYNDLADAFDNSLVYLDDLEIEVSKSSTTMVYYLDVLADLDERSDFCDVFLAAMTLAKSGDDVLARVNPKKVPEARTDYNNLLKCVANKDDCDEADFHAGKDVHNLAKTCR